MSLIYIFAVVFIILTPIIYGDLLRKNTIYFGVTLIFILHYVLGSLLNLVLENGMYVTESFRATYFNYSSIALAFFGVVFAFLAVKGVDQGVKFKTFRFRQYKPFIKYFTLTVFSLLVINYLISPKPYIDPGITRHNFLSNSRLGFFLAYFGNIASFIPIVFGYLNHVEKDRKYIISFLTYLLLMIATGHKVGSLFTVTFYFFFPHIVSSYKRNIDFLLQKKKVIILFCAGILGLNLIAYNYFNPYSSVRKTSMEATFYRASIQTHLWWASFNDWDKTNYKNYEQLARGMRTLMYNLTGHSRYSYEYDTSKNARYTYAYPSILVYLFPLHFSLLIHAAFALYIGIIYGICVNYLKSGSILPYVLSFQLVAWNYNIFSMADIYQLTSPRYVLVVLMLGSIAILQRVAYKRAFTLDSTANLGNSFS